MKPLSWEGFAESGTQTLEVAVDLTGQMTIAASVGLDEVTSVPTSTQAKMRANSRMALAGDGCADGAYSFTGSYVAGSYQFFRGDGSTPAGAGTAAFGDAMVRAAQNITGVRNPCGIGDGVGASFSFAGGDSRESDFYATGTEARCLREDEAGQDTVNTVDYKAIPTSFAGLTCRRVGSGGNLLEADVRLNANKAWTYSAGASGCSNQLDVEGVLTHEFGHVYGLDHAGGRDLTMYPNAFTCDNWQRNLGAGDALGLNAIY